MIYMTIRKDTDWLKCIVIAFDIDIDLMDSRHSKYRRGCKSFFTDSSCISTLINFSNIVKRK